MTVGLVEEADGNEYDRDATFKAVRAQVEKWIKEAADELSKASPSR